MGANCQESDRKNQAKSEKDHFHWVKMVGAVRFELTTSWTRTTRASQATLRPATKSMNLPALPIFCNEDFPKVSEIPIFTGDAPHFGRDKRGAIGYSRP